MTLFRYWAWLQRGVSRNQSKGVFSDVRVGEEDWVFVGAYTGAGGREEDTEEEKETGAWDGKRIQGTGYMI